MAGQYPERSAARSTMKRLIISKGPRRTPVTPRQAAVQDLNRALREPGASYRALSQGLKEGGRLPPGIGETLGLRPGERPSAARLKRLVNKARGKAKADNFRGRRGKPRAGAPRGAGGKFVSRGGSRSSRGGFYESGMRQPRGGASAGAAYYAGAGGRVVRTSSASEAQERIDRTTLMPYQEQGGTAMVVRSRGNRSISAAYGGSSAGPYEMGGSVPQEAEVEVISGGRGRPRTRKTGRRIKVGG